MRRGSHPKSLRNHCNLASLRHRHTVRGLPAAFLVLHDPSELRQRLPRSPSPTQPRLAIGRHNVKRDSHLANTRKLRPRKPQRPMHATRRMPPPTRLAVHSRSSCSPPSLSTRSALLRHASLAPWGYGMLPRTREKKRRITLAALSELSIRADSVKAQACPMAAESAFSSPS